MKLPGPYIVVADQIGWGRDITSSWLNGRSDVNNDIFLVFLVCHL
jgi:hypothetical protein